MFSRMTKWLLGSFFSPVVGRGHNESCMISRPHHLGIQLNLCRVVGVELGFQTVVREQNQFTVKLTNPGTKPVIIKKKTSCGLWRTFPPVILPSWLPHGHSSLCGHQGNWGQGGWEAPPRCMAPGWQDVQSDVLAVEPLSVPHAEHLCSHLGGGSDSVSVLMNTIFSWVIPGVSTTYQHNTWAQWQPRAL